MPSSQGISLLPGPRKKTIFLSLFRTIIHTTTTPPVDGYDFALDLVTKDKIIWTLYVILRPGLDEFLQAAKKARFQIVIFTWWPRWPRDMVSSILSQIDPTGEIIAHRLFQDNCLGTTKEKLVMDLALTGRRPDGSVVIDHNPDVNVKPWCNNAVKVSPFTGDINDVELWSLLSFFEIQGKFRDLRNLLHVCSCAPPKPRLPLPHTTRKTLFLDLDETLIRTHVSDHKPSYQYDFVIEKCYVKKRPGIDKLLQVATDYGYEVVIFTAGRPDYASPVIKGLDPKGLIAHRLYRDSCSDSVHRIKDLAATGRSLDKCVIIDDKWSRVLQSENVIRIRAFTGDMKDSELTRLLCFFKIEREYEDLRDAVRHVNYQLGYLKK